MKPRRRGVLPCWLLVVSFVFSGCIDKPVTIEILHINDLHSNFDYGRTPDLGGYAAVKYMLSSLKAQAARAGHDTLTINAGDSFEGHPYYFINKGAESLKLVAALGCDVTIPGEHDLMMGPADFDALLGELPWGFNLVGSNFKYDASKYKNVARNLRSYLQIAKGGLKIGIIGLTTDSPLYAWAAGDIRLTDPIVAAAALIPQLRAQNDMLIVVSHLGTADDLRLVQATAGIDLVVGSHDHAPLGQPLMQGNLVGKQVPILQSAPYGEGIGQLILTVNKDRTYAINSYRIVPVPSQYKDPAVDELVRAESRHLQDWFGASWLDAKIAATQVPLYNDEDASTPWGQSVAEALRVAGHADLALDFGAFHGMTQLPGPITRRTIMQAYPRMLAFSKTGWSVWTMQLPGTVLKTALSLLVSSPYHFELAGGTYTVVTASDGSKALGDAQVGGQPLDSARVYSVAVPEGIARAAIGIPKLRAPTLGKAVGALSSGISRDALDFIDGDLRALSPTFHDTGIPIWAAIEQYLQSSTPARALNQPLDGG